MGKFRIEIKPKAQNDLNKHFKSGNLASIKKIEKAQQAKQLKPKKKDK